MVDIEPEVVRVSLSKILTEGCALLEGASRQVEWIEKELRPVQGLLEQFEQSTYNQNAQELNEMAKKLKDTTLDANNVDDWFSKCTKLSSSSNIYQIHIRRDCESPT